MRVPAFWKAADTVEFAPAAGSPSGRPAVRVSNPLPFLLRASHATARELGLLRVSKRTTQPFHSARFHNFPPGVRDRSTHHRGPGHLLIRAAAVGSEPRAFPFSRNVVPVG